MHSTLRSLKSHTQGGYLTGRMLRSSPSGPRISRPDLCDASLQIIEQSGMQFFHFLGNECRARVRIHCPSSLPHAHQHVGGQQSSGSRLIESRVKDLLRQIGTAKSVATILFPEARAALEYDSRYRVISQLGNRFPPLLAKRRMYLHPSQWRTWHRAARGGANCADAARRPSFKNSLRSIGMGIASPKHGFDVLIQRELYSGKCGADSR